MNRKGTAYEALNKLAGRWNTSGTVLETPDSPAFEFSGTDTYEWILEGNFLQHTVDVMMGEDRNQSLEIFSYDPVAAHYILQSYDNHGNIEKMTATVDDGLWKIVGDALRFEGRMNAEESVFSGIWQQKEGEDWVDLMEVVLRRAG